MLAALTAFTRKRSVMFDRSRFPGGTSRRLHPKGRFEIMSTINTTSGLRWNALCARQLCCVKHQKVCSRCFQFFVSFWLEADT